MWDLATVKNLNNFIVFAKVKACPFLGISIGKFVILYLRSDYKTFPKCNLLSPQLLLDIAAFNN